MEIKKSLAALVLLAVTAGSASALSLPIDKYTLDRDQLPTGAREFLETYFPKKKVGMIKVDKHLLKKTDYDVKLVNGTRIEFDNSGNWTTVDCKDSAVPSELLLKTIRRYLDKNFSGQKVVRIVKKALAYELTLADGVQLKFDRLGTFKSMGMTED